MNGPSLFEQPYEIQESFSPDSRLVLYQGDVSDFLATIPDESVSLVITSPPYNLGKDYEDRVSIEHYLEMQTVVIQELYRVLRSDGSLCWQVGKLCEDGEVFPLDILYYPIFKKLNPICAIALSGILGMVSMPLGVFLDDMETILWFTKSKKYVQFGCCSSAIEIPRQATLQRAKRWQTIWQSIWARILPISGKSCCVIGKKHCGMSPM